jgi:bla regulator protein blaR1
MRLIRSILVVLWIAVLWGCEAGKSQPQTKAPEKSEAAAAQTDTGTVETNPNVIGHWTSVDFVDKIEDFKPGTKRFRGDLYLKEFEFRPNGQTHLPFMTWTPAGIYHQGDKTLAKFVVKTFGQDRYLFMEWISGDVIQRGAKPKYYVLRQDR